jgi:hypothetical protein
MGIYCVGIVVCCGLVKFLGSTFVIPSPLAHIVHGFVVDKNLNSYVVPLGLGFCYRVLDFHSYISYSLLVYWTQSLGMPLCMS